MVEAPNSISSATKDTGKQLSKPSIHCPRDVLYTHRHTMVMGLALETGKKCTVLARKRRMQYTCTI